MLEEEHLVLLVPRPEPRRALAVYIAHHQSELDALDLVRRRGWLDHLAQVI